MEEQAQEVGEPSSGQRVLRRSSSDRMIAGVAGGLGRYLGVDPVLLRVALVLLAVFGGSGLLLYAIGWLVIPEEGPSDHLGPPPSSGGDTVRVVLGLVLVVVGSIMLVGRLAPALGRFVAPLVLIAVGTALLVAGRR